MSFLRSTPATMLNPTAFFTSAASRVVWQSAVKGSTLTIGAAAGLADADGALSRADWLGEVAELMSTWLLGVADASAVDELPDMVDELFTAVDEPLNWVEELLTAEDELPVMVLMTVTVVFVVEPEEQAETVRVSTSRSRMVARRMLVTLAAIWAREASPDRSRFVKDRSAPSFQCRGGCRRTVASCSASSSSTGHRAAQRKPRTAAHPTPGR